MILKCQKILGQIFERWSINRNIDYNTKDMRILALMYSINVFYNKEKIMNKKMLINKLVEFLP